MASSRRLTCIALLSLAAACDASFLHDVPSIDLPNDLTCGGAVAPTNVAVASSPTGATVTWQATLGDDFSVVVQRQGEDGVWGERGRVGSTAGAFVDGLCTTPNSRCVYRVIAASSSCQTLPSAEVTAYTPPEAVAGFSAVGDQATAHLAWQANNLYASSYGVERSDEGGAYVTVATVTAPALNYDDTALSLNRSYCYRLTAITDAGSGPAVESCTKSGPAGIDATVDVHVDVITLSWADPNTYETGYTVYKDGTVVADLPADSVRFDDTAVVSGQIVTYQIVARSPYGDSPATTYFVPTIDTTITEGFITVGSCTISASVSLAPPTASRLTALEGVNEVASTASVSGTAPNFTLSGAIDGTAGVGAFDILWSATLDNGDTFESVFTHRLRFASLLELVGPPNGTPYVGEGLQPWTGNSASTCNGAFGRLASIAAGGRSNCVSTNDGRVVCWGEQQTGTLGSAVSSDSAAPHGVCSASSGLGCNGQYLVGVMSVGMGNDDVYAVKTDGTLVRWGSNPVTGTPNNLPQAQTGIDNVLTVAGGGQFACATRTDGTISCWGENGFGQLGRGVSSVAAGPAAVCTGTTPCVAVTGFTTVAVGQAHACGSNAGTAMCWGKNDKGQVGLASSQTTVLQAQSVSGVSNVTQLAAGVDFTCAATQGSAVYCWGSRAEGALGDNTIATTHTNVPVQVHGIDDSGTLGSVVAIAAGDDHVCALSGSGTVACWGSNAYGQLGDTTHTTSGVPRSVMRNATTPLTNVAAISAGQAHTCAVLADASVVCWGDNSHLQLGNAAAGADSAVPVPVLCDGFDASCSVRADTMYRAGVRGRGSLEALLQ